MEKRGTLIRWDDDKGFGFIRPTEGGRELFVHISAVRGEQRPSTGSEVIYQADQDELGRPRATYMRNAGTWQLDDPSIRRKPRSAPLKNQQAVSTESTQRNKEQGRALFTNRISGIRLKLSLFVLLCAAPAYGSYSLALEKGNYWPALAYLIVSLMTFALYVQDKNSAIQSKQRIPENSLHLAELLGGWPGALLAQQLLRHKTRKLSYQAMFWLIVGVHQVFWLDYLYLDQAGLSRLIKLGL